jgi:hypothetical protein
MHNACFTDNILTTKMKKENKTATYPSETKKKKITITNISCQEEKPFQKNYTKTKKILKSDLSEFLDLWYSF